MEMDTEFVRLATLVVGLPETERVRDNVMVRDTEVVRDRDVRPVATVEEGLRLHTPVITVRDTVGEPDDELSDPIVPKHKKRTLKIATSISSKAVPARKQNNKSAKGCKVGLGKVL